MANYAFRGGYKDLALVYLKSKGIDDSLEYFVKSPFIEDNIAIKVNMVSFTLNYESYLNNICTFKLYEENDEIIYDELKEFIL